MKLGASLIKTINDTGLSYGEALYVLSKAVEEDWGVEISAGSISKLVALGYLQSNLRPDNAAFTLLNLLTSGEVNDEGFEQFYKSFPLKDPVSGRQIRTKRTECKEEYSKCVMQHSSEDIIKGARNYVMSHTDLKYIKGPLRFLQDRAFLDYLQEYKDTSYGEELA